MSEEDENQETHFTTVGVEATLKKEETTELEASATVSAEKLRKAQLLDELNQEVAVRKELPKRKPPTAQIPDKAKLGEKFTVKLEKRYDSVNIKVYQGEKVKKNAGNSNCVHDKTKKRTDEIDYDFYDPVPLKGKTFNGLTKGKYLIIISAHGTEQGDEFEQEHIIDVE